MTSSSIKKTRSTSEAILRSLSHDMREPIRSIRRTFGKLKDEFISAGLELNHDDLAALDEQISGLGETIKEYRANTKEKVVNYEEISQFLSGLINGQLSIYLENLSSFEASHRQTLARRPYKAFFDTAQRQSARFKRRLISLQSYADAEGGIVKNHFGLHNEVFKVEEELSALIEQRNVDVTVVGAANVIADQLKIAQVIQNLFENAIAYNEQNRPKVSFLVRQTRDFALLSTEFKGKFTKPPHREWVMLRCTDNGRGIPEEEKSKVLKAFVRGSTNGQLNVDGSGLGLAICKSVVEAHGGFIQIDSVVDRGTAIKIAIPAR